jgi:hypothetical protein
MDLIISNFKLNHNNNKILSEKIQRLNKYVATSNIIQNY